MQLDQQNRPGSGDGLQSSLKNLFFSAFNIDFDQIGQRQRLLFDQAIKPANLYLDPSDFILNLYGCRRESAKGRIGRHYEIICAIVCGEGDVSGNHIGKSIDAEIVFEQPEVFPQRLEGKNAPGVPGKPGGDERQKSYVGSDVVNHGVGSNQKSQSVLRFRLGTSQKKADILGARIEAQPLGCSVLNDAVLMTKHVAIPVESSLDPRMARSRPGDTPDQVWRQKAGHAVTCGAEPVGTQHLALSIRPARRFGLKVNSVVGMV
jgi:hypothetical protein